ncbi:response regulator [Duganella sp. FT3S]|uniref:histidine kinase n=1 Tax=Rugamonas fusca TaxID=2758568 RepID=A0A7W2EL30_9BURK|nr:ATP-binding protein [Rugamonas fusca]MBA5607797.1 response regulator [Rugamonas fusca]
MSATPIRPARDASIALIVSATLTGVVTLVLLAFALLYYDMERERRWDALRQTLATSADQLAVAVALPVWNFDPSQIEVLMFSALSNRNLQAAVVSARPSQLDYVVRRDASGALRGGGAVPTDASLLRATRPIMVEGQRVGEVAVYATPAPLLAELRRSRLAIVGIIVVLDAALVASVYLLLWHLMLKPLKAVGQYAASVEAGGPGLMRPGVRFYGELRTLSASVRNMVALLDKRYRDLQQGQERLQIATQAAGVGIWDWDVVRDELVWDDKMFEQFRVQRDQFCGAYAAWSAAVLPEDLPAAAAEVAAALRGEREYATEFRIRWPDGSIRTIRAESLIFRDAQGHALRMVGVNYDVTAARLAEQELLRHRNHLEELVAERTAALSAAVSEAKAANRAKSVFLATMSHELRTPLNAVIGFSRLMGESATMGTDEKRNLAIIHRAGQQLLRLINDILELSKIEAGRAVLQSEAVDPGELAREAVDMVRARAGQAGVALTLRCHDLPPAVRLDGAKLRQVLLNLMSNAVKFAERGQVMLELRGRAREEGGYWLDFAVRDSGIGIASADQARIFEPFYRADDGDGKEGTGLGLAISRDFVELMGGTLAVESAPGQGTVFSFTLAAGAEDVSRLAPSAEAQAEVCGLAPRQRGKRVLVVDDNADGRQLLVSLLAPLGFVVLSADSGTAALEVLAREAVDLLLVDWRMPGMDGLELTRRLRGGVAAQPRVVVLTASAFEEERQQALAAGADDFLRKPVEQEALFQVLERLLGVVFERRPRAADGPAAPAAPAATAAQMARLPASVRAALRGALRELNQPKVLDILAPYRAGHGPLVEAVAAMLQQYQYRQLCRLIEEAEGMA